MPTLIGTGQITIADVNDAASITLAPPSQVLAATNEGVVTQWASTTATIREGAVVGEDWTFSAPVSSQSDNNTDDLTFEWSSSQPGIGLLILTGMLANVDAAYVDITATKLGASPLTARYVVTKARAGNPAKFALLKSSASSIKRSGDTAPYTYSPSSITFSAVSISAGLGTSLGVGTPVAYGDGYIRIEAYDGSTWTAYEDADSEDPASSRQYPESGSLYHTTKMVRATLATTSGFTEILDQITVPIVEDGRSAYSVALTNGYNGTESEWLDTLVGTFDPTMVYPNADPEVDPPIPINVSGNAATATALETPRTINGVSFDGSADVVIPVVKSTQTINLDASGSLAWTSGGEFSGGSYRDYTITSVDASKCMVSITSSIGNSLGLSVTTASTLRNAKVSVVNETTLRLSINTTHVSAVSSTIVGSVRIVEFF